MTTTAESTGLDSRTELRAWYLGRLRPRLEEAVIAGIVEPGSLDELDYQLAELLISPDDVREDST
jgi:hypothetical protein